MCASASEAFVTLRGGLIVPVDALKLAWSLEDRGGIFLVENDELIIDGPAGLLTDRDRAAIRRWRNHLKAIATYQAPEVIARHLHCLSHGYCPYPRPPRILAWQRARYVIGSVVGSSRTSRSVA
jgi:hypothetical protein